MPKKLPPESKRDVVTVARRGDFTVAEVAADVDISPESVRRWMRQADIDDGVRDGMTAAEHSELVQLRRSEMENEILGVRPRTSRRTRSDNELPAGPRAGRRGVPGAADLSGARLHTAGVLQVARATVLGS